MHGYTISLAFFIRQSASRQVQYPMHLSHVGDQQSLPQDLSSFYAAPTKKLVHFTDPSYDH